MNPPLSLLSLDEPVYLLVGIVLPGDGSGEVEVVVAPDAADRYPEAARPMLEYFSVPRGESEVLAQLTQWDSEPRDLDRLVEGGVLVRLPAHDELGVRAAIAPLTLGVTAQTKPSSDGTALLLFLPDDRAVLMSPVTLAVLNSEAPRSLGDGVEAVARESALSRDHVWRRLLVDLNAILGHGAGHLTKPGESA